MIRIAMIMTYHLRISLIALLCLIMHSCQTLDEEVPKEITKIETENSQYIIKDGEFLTINVIHTPSDLPAPKYDLMVADSEILSDRTIDELMIRGRKPGVSEVTIVVLNNPSVVAKCTVTVEAKDVESVTLDKEYCELLVGEHVQLTPTILPSDASYKDVEWAVEDSTVANISHDGIVTALSVGETVVEGRAVNSSIFAQCRIIVKPTSVTGVQFDAYESAILLGEQLKLNAQILPDNATNKELVWSSSDENVAIVDNSGMVTAVGLGNVNIIAKSVDGEHLAIASLAVYEIDYFVSGHIGLQTIYGSGYVTYELYIIIETTNGKSIDISRIELFNQSNRCIDSHTNIGSRNEYRMETFVTSGNTYGCYYILYFSYAGKEYTKYFYNY